MQDAVATKVREEPGTSGSGVKAQETLKPSVAASTRSGMLELMKLPWTLVYFKLLGVTFGSITKSLEIVSPVLPMPITSKRILKRVTLPGSVATGAGGDRMACESSALPRVLSMMLVALKLLAPKKGRPP